jgi:hypothetical protein
MINLRECDTWWLAVVQGSAGYTYVASWTLSKKHLVFYTVSLSDAGGLRR